MKIVRKKVVFFGGRCTSLDGTERIPDAEMKTQVFNAVQIMAEESEGLVVAHDGSWSVGQWAGEAAVELTLPLRIILLAPFEVLTKKWERKHAAKLQDQIQYSDDVIISGETSDMAIDYAKHIEDIVDGCDMAVLFLPWREKGVLIGVSQFIEYFKQVDRPVYLPLEDWKRL